MKTIAINLKQERMKKLMLLMFVILGVGLVSAQSKIAHVNTQEIMGKMPLYIESVQKLHNFQNAGYDELQAIKKSLDAGVQAYTQKVQSGTLTPAAQQQEEQRLAKLEQDLVERQQSLQTEMQAYSNELNAPIQAKVEQAINIVADRYGFEYVFDVSTTLIHRGPDITDEVIAVIKQM